MKKACGAPPLLALRLSPRYHEVPGHAGQAPPGVLAIFLLKLDANVLPTQKGGGDEAAPRSREWVQDDIAGFRERFDDRFDRINGLLGRMAGALELCLGCAECLSWEAEQDAQAVLRRAREMEPGG